MNCWEHLRRGIGAGLAGICVSFPLLLSAAEDVYHKPDYSTLPFPDSGLPLAPDQKAVMLDSLAAIARNFSDVSVETKARAVALSRRIDPLHKDTFIADYQLNRGVEPERMDSLRRKEEPAQSLYRLIKEMLGNGSEEADQFCGYVLDLLQEFQPDEVDYKLTYQNNKDKFGDVSWDAVVVQPVALAVEMVEPEVKEATSAAGAIHSVGFLTTKGVLQIKSEQHASSDLKYKVGDLLDTPVFASALREGIKYLGQKNPGGVAVEFSIDADQTSKFFEEQGPAAALGCILSARAMLDERSFDPSVAYVGDVNADGSIQPLRDVKDRLLGLDTPASLIIAIPQADSRALEDLLILKGPGIFSKYQIFGLKTVQSAEGLSQAPEDRPEELQNAIKKFREIQAVLKKPGGMKYLRNSHVLARLKEVTDLAPNHLSAKMLAYAGMNRYPKQLTLGSSLELVMEPIKPLMLKGDLVDTTNALDPDALASMVKFKNKIDPRLAALTRAVIAYSNAGRTGSDKFRVQKEALARLKDELSAVGRNIAVREEMMR